MFAQETAAAETTTAKAKWRADGFINLYLVDKEGKRRKLGALSLKDSDPRQKTLRAWLEEDPSRVAKVLSALVADYQPAVRADAPDFEIIESEAE